MRKTATYYLRKFSRILVWTLLFFVILFIFNGHSITTPRSVNVLNGGTLTSSKNTNVLATSNIRPMQPSEIEISGLVNRPLTFTYSELLSFPMVSEVATLECIDRTWKKTLNWTGIPLFHLLTISQVKSEAQGVIFRASDGFLSRILIEEALEPTTILALRANGTLLSEITGREGGFRVVVPCKWGYYWVTDVKEIEVTDYIPTTDEEMPDCMQPSITPPLQVINIPIGNREFQIEAFANVSITAFTLNYLQNEISFNVTVPSETVGFTDFIMQQDLFKEPYSVFSNGETIDIVEAHVSNLTFLYLTFQEGLHTVRIVGTDFFGAVPQLIVEFNQTAWVGETIIFDASKSTDDGKIISCEWGFGDSTGGSGVVTSHSYYEEGTYQVVLKATDNDGLSNSITLTVNVQKEIGYIAIIEAISTITVGVLVLIVITLQLKKYNDTRKKKTK